MNDTQRVARDAQLAVAMKQAVVDGDVQNGEKLANALFKSNPDWILRGASSDEIEVRRMIHEIYADFLLTLVFSDGNTGDLWRQLSEPVRGVFISPLLVTNARWLRTFGSPLVDRGLEELDPKSLANLGYEAQAKQLGRYCSVNDGAREIDYNAVYNALDPRLRAAFGHWVTAVCLASPGNLADSLAASSQAQVAADFCKRHRNDTSELAGSTMLSNMPYAHSYRDDMQPKELAPIVNGQLARRMFEEFGSNQADPTDGGISDFLHPGGEAVMCPNWRDGHVAFRCCSDAVASLRGPSFGVLMVHESSMRNAQSGAWEQDTFELTLPGKRHFIQELGGYAEQVKRAKLDFLFYPEVTPSNATVWLASSRLARVQAAGYGYPVTTGSAHMDYFVGGSEVESDGSDYTEQLVLLPGLGVSTTAPPMPSRPRSRGYDEAELRLATITTWQKMNPGLLRAWEAILGDQPNASMDVFSAMTQGQASCLLPGIAPHIQNAQINLQLSVSRDQVLLTLGDADLYLDSFPYGGFNSLVEVLVSGCPMVTLEGTAARHRFGAAMLRRLELPDFLIAKTQSQFIAAARRLMMDTGLRQEVRAQIGCRESVLARLSDPDIGEHFAAAVEWMRKAGPRKGRAGKPVLIEAGSPTIRQPA